MVEIDLFGIPISFGNTQENERKEIYKEYEITNEELLKALNINQKVVFIKHDYKTKKLYIKVKNG